ncbi:MAG: UDP-N-acetylglucosamine 1-carboxyvinyltransferase [Candidatus Pacebacteria bacterium]|nr:UDP-N-acetylglucosamine 1-carboxyvinyltransferase [Candidatus Paceibacterota bacterium]
MPPSDQEKIGLFIKKLRDEKGITQADFAKRLKTSQSAVARIESGNQNVTIEQLMKIGEVLNHNIVSLQNTIDFKVKGGKKLHGAIVTNTSKNGAINMMVAALVNSGTTTLRDIPHIEEVLRYKELLESVGVTIRWTHNDSSLEITPPKKFSFQKINKDVAERIRSFTFAGAFVHHAETFKLPHSGGCKMGERTVASHKYALEYLGVSVETKSDHYIISHKELHAGTIPLYESSDTGAITALIAAARIPGVTVIKFAPPNYQVQDVCFLLEAMGVKIDGIGSTTLTVHGIATVNKTIEHFNSEDPIESMFFISAGIVTKSSLTIKRCPIEFLTLELEKLKRMGLTYSMSKEYFSKNGRTVLVDIKVSPSNLTAPYDKIHALPFPGINNDNLPFFVPIACFAEGQTLIHDWTWENRAIYFTELNRLGADIKLLDPHRALVTGVKKLRGAQIVSPPALRPTAIILIAMLAAEGESLLRNVYSIKRGYADIAERLNSIGADIQVIKGV